MVVEAEVEDGVAALVAVGQVDAGEAGEEAHAPERGAAIDYRNATSYPASLYRCPSPSCCFCESVRQ